MTTYTAHDPFGDTLRSTGPRASTNPWRFSTKYTDQESGWLYYGYRYYAPRLGRWVSRDPSGEAGALNTSCFLENSAISVVDLLGLIGWGPGGGPGQVFPGDFAVPELPSDSYARGTIALFILGLNNGNISFGPDNPWTQKMRNHPAMRHAVDVIRSDFAEHCRKYPNAPPPLPASPGDEFQVPLGRLPLDLLSYIGLGDTSYSTGSWRWQGAIADLLCCDNRATITFTISDTLDVTSMTRHPRRRGISWLPHLVVDEPISDARDFLLPGDLPPLPVRVVWPTPGGRVNNPFGSTGPLHNLHISWQWSESLSW